MTSYQRARWDNAKRFGNRISKLIKSGCLVFDSDGRSVGGILINEEGVFQVFDNGFKLIIFLNDTELDNGMYTTVKEFNTEYGDWSYIKPEDKHKLIW